MSLTTPPSVQTLQTALHDKAKGTASFRFYALYDKVYRMDVLEFAYECCKANGGAGGVDGQTFEDIENYNLKRWLDELTQELKSRTYQPQPVRRVWIPKPDGKQRPLGVPAIKDRGNAPSKSTAVVVTSRVSSGCLVHFLAGSVSNCCKSAPNGERRCGIGCRDHSPDPPLGERRDLRRCDAGRFQGACAARHRGNGCCRAP